MYTTHRIRVIDASDSDDPGVGGDGRNNAATGVPTISGTAQAGETLTANTSGIADEDGLNNVEFSYQWLADDGNADIEGETGSTYGASDDDVGKSINEAAVHMNELHILKWIAGAAVPTPQLDGIDVDHLLELSRKHRLEARFLQRLWSDSSVRVSNLLTSRLNYICEQLNDAFRYRLQVLLELHSEYVSEERYMLPIKGDTAYLLTQNSTSIRHSDDIDIIASHPAEFRMALQRLGFEDYDTLSVYNFVISTRGSVGIDGHKYFPVYGYPRVANKSELNAAENPGQWIQNSEPQLIEITADTFLEHSRIGVHPLAGPLRLPTLEMALLVSCANVFKEFFQYPPESEVTITLAHLAEIRDLSSHPAFDSVRFLQLVDRHSAYDAVEFVGQMCSEVFNYSPLPSTSERESTSQDHIFLFYYLAWLPAPWSIDDLLLCQDRRKPLEQLLKVLGSNKLACSKLGRRCLFGSSSARSQGPVRVVARGYDLSALRVDIGVQWTAHALVLDLFIGGQIAPHEVFIAYFGDTCLWISGDDCDPVSPGPKADFEYRLVEGGYELSVRLYWGSSPYLNPSRLSVPMLLAVAKLDSGPNGELVFFRPRAAAVIPLEIYR